MLEQIPLNKVAKRYFFESDMLFRLNIARAAIEDVPMSAVYGSEESNLRIGKILLPFLSGHIRNFCKRIVYNYFLRDFNMASIELLLGLPFLIFGIWFGLVQWDISADRGVEASAGTVMLSALPIIVGVQLLLSFLQYDIQSVPKSTLHRLLGVSRSADVTQIVKSGWGARDRT